MRTTFLVLGLLFSLAAPGLRGQSPEPVVHAVLFFSPTCGHCHQLITEHLIPMQEEYGRSLVILGMDTSQPWANNLYWETIRHFELPEEDWVVPMMVIGDEVLTGGIAIPDRLNRAMEEELPEGGIDLPNYPPLLDLLREQDALDSRYPDRLIIRQDSPAQEETDPAQEQPSEEVTEAETEPEPAAASVEADTTDAGVEVGGEAETVPVDTTAVQTGPGTEATVKAESPAGEPPTTSGPGESGTLDSETPPPPETEGQPPTTADSPEPEDQEGPASPADLGLSATARSLEDMGPLERFGLDPQGNSVSVLVLLAMLVSLALRGFPPNVTARPWPAWAIPLLVLVGASAAAYLSFIEVTQTEAVCGPVGDCNTVNQSAYATLFGVLPVGVLGLLGYGLIMGLWLIWRSASGSWGRKAALGLWMASLFGTLFSVYLTFLEPFVIGATCMWCITSAVTMTLILWASSPMAAEAWPQASTSAKEV